MSDSDGQTPRSQGKITPRSDSSGSMKNFVSPETVRQQGIVRGKGISEPRSKLQRAGLKAAHTYELARAFDISAFRQKVDTFLHVDFDSRTEEQVEDFVKLVLKKGKYKFLQQYTEQQQRQLARIALPKTSKRDQFLFRQEEVPDALYLLVSGRCGIFRQQGEAQKLLGVVGTGDSVGDLMHLDERGRRSCTGQITSDNAELIMFKRQDLDVLAVQWRVHEETAKTEFIMNLVPVLNSVPKEVLENMSLYFDKIKVPKDTIVYKQQDDASIIYFIWEGEVQLIKRIDLIKVSKKAP